MADPMLSPPPLRIGCVTLTVQDLDGVAEFYQSVIGLNVLTRNSTDATLGAGATPLLKLRRDTAARRHDSREAGLFHTAFLLPDRADLGRWLKLAAERGLHLSGAADHGVSEALYVSDPEGNGIEIYVDRPRSTWAVHGGMVEIPNNPIDLSKLLAAGADNIWRGAPTGTTIGHVHLQVGNIPQAEAFYRDRLGLSVTWRYPKATFYGSGGYHHHIATNVWNSEGAGVCDRPVTGISEVELLARDAATLNMLRGVDATSAGAEDFLLQDPWGTSIRLAIA